MRADLLLLVAGLQQQGQGTGFTSPPSGDTAGYWQQRVRYRIAARLDEERQVLRAAGDLVYVNNSPDSLREMYVHQYLNAFRPRSRWSADDAREGRVRFQRLRDPDYGYERFTAPVTADGAAVRVEYPGAPDSTVARFALPRPLAPGDSTAVHFEWDARPSTLPRRQGRQGRRYDFAQWYPKVAVYDRGGWQYNALRPAGEFYGEFGAYDVTLTVAADQVIGATGVPVAGDPGWTGALRWGEAHLQRDAYGAQPGMLVITAAADSVSGPRTKTVRFVARDVHHFAWSTSPQYRYEGSLYDGRIAVHVLYQPGDESEWGNGQAVRRTELAIRWLESVYGRYAYPQMTNLHRIEGGGTEFPMMMMNGSGSQGLILHEGGHVYSYGILANNEWRSGWMDEGLTSYQTSWAQRVPAQERRGDTIAGVAYVTARPPSFSQRPAGGYAGRAVRPRPLDFSDLEQFRLDLVGRAEPIGTVAHEFREFGIYNSMIYTRAEMMYGALRDAIGDTAFAAFMRLYYDRWRLKHVDERAMRKAAEDASGRDLGWFFEQWVHRTGLVDYALAQVRTERRGSEWVTRARVVRRGEYRHPMPVGVRVGSAWVVARADPLRDRQWVEIRTAERPAEVRLDPYQVTTDWDRRNDVRWRFPYDRRVEQYVVDWPFLEQTERGRTVEAVTPIGWYTSPGRATLGLRSRSSYQGVADRNEVGVAISTRLPDPAPRRLFDDVFVRDEGPSEWSRVQFWYVFENPRLRGRPAMGWRFGAWFLDGGAKLELRKRWDASPFTYARGPAVSWTAALNGTLAAPREWIDSARWEPNTNEVDLGLEFRRRAPGAAGLTLRARALGGLSVFDDVAVSARARGFGRVEAEATARRALAERLTLAARGFVGASARAPLQRAIGVSSLDATETYENHLLRGRGAPLARPDVHYVELGGGGMRGYSPLLRTERIAAINLEAGYAVARPAPAARRPELAVGAFADAAVADDMVLTTHLPGVLADAGVGLALRGPLFDRTVRVRLDFPLFVRHAGAAVGADAGEESVTLRWMFSFRDLW